MHSNQQLATLHEHFCAKLLSNCKEFDPEIFSCTTTHAHLANHVAKYDITISKKELRIH